MIPSGLFAQITLILLSVGIIFTYVRPTFTELSETQDQIAVYQEERGKVESVNQTLKQKLATIDTVGQEDTLRLRTYMPNHVDPLAVMRDVELITEQSGVSLKDIIDNGPVESSEKKTSKFVRSGEQNETVTPAVSATPYPYAFTVFVQGSYNQLKILLDLLETNNYPLEVRSLEVNAGEGGFLDATLELYTYAHQPPVEEDVSLFQDVNVTYE